VLCVRQLDVQLGACQPHADRFGSMYLHVGMLQCITVECIAIYRSSVMLQTSCFLKSMRAVQQP
jgi:hypothetical protein